MGSQRTGHDWVTFTSLHFTSGRSSGEGNGNPFQYSCLVGCSPWDHKKVRDNLGTKQQKCRKVDQTWKEVLPWINGIMCWLISTAFLDSLYEHIALSSFLSISLCVHLSRKSTLKKIGDFPGDPVVKTSPSHGGGVQSLVRELRSHVLCGQKTKTWPRRIL